MPHYNCSVISCGNRIPSTVKRVRKSSEPKLWTKVKQLGLPIAKGAIICENCRNEIIRKHKAVMNETTGGNSHADELPEAQAGNSRNLAIPENLENVEEDNDLANDHYILEISENPEPRIEYFGLVPSNNAGTNNSNQHQYSAELEIPTTRNNNLAKLAADYADSEDSEDNFEHPSELYDFSNYEDLLLEPLDIPLEADESDEDISMETESPIMPETTFSEGGSSIYEAVSQELESQSSGSSASRASPKRRSRKQQNRNSKFLIEDVLSVATTQARCFVCRENGTTRNRVPEAAAIDLWLRHRVLVPKGRVRCCAEHIQDNIFTQEAVNRIVMHAQKGAYLTSQELATWLQRLADQSKTKKAVLDFDSPTLRDEDYKLLTGLHLNHFNELLGYIENSLHVTKHRSPRNALAIYLMLCRLAVSQNLLSFMFGIPVQRISDVIARVTNLLSENFVPKFLGYDHLSRNEAKLHVPKFVRKLYNIPDENLAFLFDATYVYIQKPQDFKCQRETYSMQKKRNLVKPMMAIFPDGYILDSEGPYKANTKNNDAGILLHMFSQPNGISDYIQEGDHFIVDRGFRDAVKEMKKRKLVVHMPELLKGQRQFTWQQANASRKVTMTRWTVEAVNGRIKHVFRFFDNTIYNSYFFKNKLKKMWRISCAILNAFFPPLYVDEEKHDRILEHVDERLGKRNELKAKVEKNGWDKKRSTTWIKATSQNISEFPKLTEMDVFDITVGVYQTKNAILYTKQHLNEDPEYSIQVHLEEANILRAQIQSRFHNNDHHMLWIEFDNSESASKKIGSYFCRCKTGSRTLGTCSHITSVIWYLGYFRHQDKNIRKKSFCDILLDAADIGAGEMIDSE